MVLRVRDRVLPSPRPFEEVKSDIENVLKLRKSHDLTLVAALAAKEKIESGQDLDSVLSVGQKVERPGAVTRKDVSRLDQKVLNAVFELSHPSDNKAEVKDVILDNGDVVLVMLEKVNNSESINHERVMTVKRQLKQEFGSREFIAVLNAYKDAIDINRNPKVLQ